MIKVIVGRKGSGKTARLVDDLNAHATSDNANVVCIERGRRLDRLVKYQIRLLDISDYPIVGFRELLAFIAGISAKDYDLTHIYIDSIFKIANDTSMINLEKFLEELETFSDNNNFSVMIILSAEPEALPESIRRYV
ncbi:MAG: hypothetical protein ACOX1T_03855 [Saccharofermentanales bacterium]